MKSMADGRYRPAVIEEVGDGALQGYSQMLDLYLRWKRGELTLIGPATGRHIAAFEGERARADAEREARIEEMEARAIAEAERNATEARIRELEEENRRLRGG